VELGVRSGGHSVAGYSSTDGGIVLDLSEMRAVEGRPGRSDRTRVYAPGHCRTTDGVTTTRAAIRPAIEPGSRVVALAFASVAFGISAVASAFVTMLTVWLLARFALRRIAGIAGDVLGAAEQVGEVTLLLLGVALVRHHWPTVPWWR
jgi:Cobalamin-5-phosphate synthase